MKSWFHKAGVVLASLSGIAAAALVGSGESEARPDPDPTVPCVCQAQQAFLTHPRECLDVNLCGVLAAENGRCQKENPQDSTMNCTQAPLPCQFVVAFDVEVKEGYSCLLRLKEDGVLQWTGYDFEHTWLAELECGTTREYVMTAGGQWAGWVYLECLDC